MMPDLLSTMIYAMACCLFGSERLPKSMLTCYQLNLKIYAWNFNKNMSVFFQESLSEYVDGLVQDCGNSIANSLGPVLLQRSDAVTNLSANGSAAFNESCAPIG